MKHAKKFLLLSFMATALLTACSDTKTKTEESKTTTTTTTQDSQTKRTDTLPPIDTTAKGKPDNANTQ